MKSATLPNAEIQTVILAVMLLASMGPTSGCGRQVPMERGSESNSDFVVGSEMAQTAFPETGSERTADPSFTEADATETPVEDTSAASPPAEEPELEKAQPDPAADQIVVADWPNWMGPRRDGVSNETGWSDRWPKDGLDVEWTREIGIGFSSVSISQGRLYTMGHSSGKETVFCLDIKTGEPIWTHAYAAPLVDNLYEGGPGSTPTVHDDFVYTLSKGGRLICFQRDGGDVIWSKELQDEFDIILPEWGFNGSPFILGEKLILECGRVVAVNKMTGETIWQTGKHKAGYGSAAVFRQADKTMLATLDCEGLRVVQADDGVEVAFFRWDSPFDTNSTTPIVIDGKIFISAGYNVGSGLFDLKNGELDLIYSNRDMRNHFNNSIFYQGRLYGFDGNSNLGRVVHLKCMDAKTGKILWRKRGLGCGSLMIANGRLVILAENGELVLADATAEEYREIARSQFLDGRCWTVPVLHGGRIYGRNASGKLVCVTLPRE